MKLKLCICLIALASTPYAQERTAASSLDTQVTWTSLKTIADDALAQAKMAQVAADDARGRTLKMEACGNKRMFYAPADTSADAQGCVSSDSLGVNQKWYAVNVQHNKVYRNTTGRTIAVAGESGWQGWGGLQISENGTTWATALDSSENDLTNPFFFVIPNNYYYRYNHAGVYRYFELR